MLRNALIPTVTVIGLQTGYLLGGSVVVERLFAWPGVGDLMLNAIGARDFTLVQAITVIFVLGFLVITWSSSCSTSRSIPGFAMAEAAAIRWRRRRNWPLWLGATLLGFYALVAAIGPLLPGIDANGQDLLAVLEPPSREHWLGTDNIGGISSRASSSARASRSPRPCSRSASPA